LRRERREFAWLCEFFGKILWILAEENRNDVLACGDLGFERRNA
jgi:hypothetical protein